MISRLGRRVKLAALGSCAIAGTSYYLYLKRDKRDAAILAPNSYAKCRVHSTEAATPDTKIITLSLPRGAAFDNGTPPPIWSVFIKDDEIQVERPYTPLGAPSDTNLLRFWVKRYPSGEVSRWLHSKQVDEEVEIRGPLVTWPWREEPWDHVIMISGGTGITPFLQLFQSVISENKAGDNTRFTLLHSSRTPTELPPDCILEPMETYARDNPEKFGIQLFVDAKGREARASRHTYKVGRISKASIAQCINPDTSMSWPSWLRSMIWTKEFVPPRRIFFLICGPEPMIAAIAGPYGRNYSQGPIGGMLQELSYTSEEVYKL